MPSDLRSVAVYAPMKRGLKVDIPIRVERRCSLCPDEKGTESDTRLCPRKGDGRWTFGVAVYAPMKRGLKVGHDWRTFAMLE